MSRNRRYLDFHRFQVEIMVTDKDSGYEPALWMKVTYNGQQKVYYTDGIDRHRMFALDHGRTYHPSRLNGTRTILPMAMMSDYFKLEDQDFQRFARAYNDMADLHQKFNYGF